MGKGSHRNVYVPKYGASTLTIKTISITKMLYTQSGACTIKHYGIVIYGKWTDLVIIECLILSITNTITAVMLAY